MKNTAFSILLAFVFLFLIFLGIRSSDGSVSLSDDSAQDPATADFKTYTDIPACTEYISFLECILVKIENEQVQWVLQKNLDSTRRVRAGMWSDTDSITTVCKNALFALGSQKYLQNYGCQWVIQDPQVKNIVDNTIWEAMNEVTTGDVAELQDENDTIDLEEETQDYLKKVQVLQNQLWFLRVRWWPWLGNAEVGRLGLNDIVSVSNEQSGRYEIILDDNKKGRVSGKYVREVIE